MVLDIKDGDELLLRVLIYHAVPQRGHRLQTLFTHNFSELTPTLFIGGFNTHSHRWSLPGRILSPWARRMEEWIDDHGLLLLNPLHQPTWFGSRETDHHSVLDLAFANDSALLSNQLGDVHVCFPDSIASDHAALLLTIIPIDSIAIIPPPAPKGYKADTAKRKLDWGVREAPSRVSPMHVYMSGTL
jgi:hypothetical protein